MRTAVLTLAFATICLVWVSQGLADDNPTVTKCKLDITKGETPYLGDFQIHNGAILNTISIGPAVSTQLLTYDLASKKSAVNTGLGAGVSLRFYSDSSVGDLKLKDVKTDCRATTVDAAFGSQDPTKPKIAMPVFSLTPMLYASKLQASSDMSVQPAIQLGFLADLVNIGVGFNLTGPNTGHVLLLLSLGYGFKF